MSARSRDPGPPGRFSRFKEALASRPLLARLLILLPVLLAGVSLFPPSFGINAFDVKIGERAPRTVTAEFDFPVMKRTADLEIERRESAGATPLVLARDDSLARSAFGSLGEFRSHIAQLRRGTRGSTPPPTMELSQSLLVWLMLAKDPGPMLDQTEMLLEEAVQRGLAEETADPLLREAPRVLVVDPAGQRDYSPETILTPSRLRDMARNRALARGLEPAPLEELAMRFARPNLFYDPQRTADLQEAARETVSPVEFTVQRGERIVEARERITPEILRRLEAYDQWRRKEEIGTFWIRLGGWIGRLLLLLVATGAFGAYLKFLRPEVYARLSDLALLSLTAALVMGLSGLFLHVLGLPSLMVPVAAAPILIGLLFDDRLALIMGLSLAGLVGAVAELGGPTMIVLGVGAVTAVFCVRGLRHRRQFYRLVLYVPAVHLVTLVALALVQAQGVSMLVRDALAACMNPVLTAGLAIFVTPLAEHAFRKCSDITLLELSDLNRPLLRRLMVEAPGTYHHSLMVGTLAETAARVSGGNPLLARVIGYYHDIGKVAKPDYYLENVQAGRKNPHDRLSPSMSRLILESHVREGVSLAVRERLPHVIAEGIRQHHGSSVMAFFWHKAKRQDPATPQEDYRYPGPRPQFREAALVMIADQIDAATRALDNPTPSRIKGTILKVLETRLAEGDLDDSELTLSDLARIRDAFVPILSAFFHARTAFQAPEDDGRRTTSPRDRESTAAGPTA